MQQISISIVEDNDKVIQNLRNLFSQSEEFQLLQVYLSADEAILHISNHPPDIIILDIGLPGKSGVEALLDLKSLAPNAKFVMYTVFEDEENIVRAIKNGANGYLLKDTPLDRLLVELKLINMGGSPLTPRVASRIIEEFENKFGENLRDHTESNILSKREKEVLNLVSLGLIYTDIADELDISPHTVSRHVENIYKKMNVHSKSQAIIRGRRLGIIRNDNLSI